MVAVQDLLDRVNDLDIGEESRTAISDTADEMILAQQQQMLHGLDAKGEKIGEYKNPLYAEAKHRFNPLAGFGNVDLRLTGSFYAEQYVLVKTDEFVMDSSDEKADALTKKYGDDIFGLSPDYEAEYIDNYLEPVLIDNVSKKIEL